jgi:hypothetical protein
VDINDPYYIEVLTALNTREVKHVLVGGLAVGYHGYARYTGDMDLWLEPSKENMVKLEQSLLDLEYDEEVIQQILDSRPLDHPTPIRLWSESGKKVDLMTTVFNDSFSFKECFDASLTHDGLGTRVNVIHINQLITLKENTKRYDHDMKDLVDAQKLKEIRSMNSDNGAAKNT